MKTSILPSGKRLVLPNPSGGVGNDSSTAPHHNPSSAKAHTKPGKWIDRYKKEYSTDTKTPFHRSRLARDVHTQPKTNVLAVPMNK